MTDIDLSKWDTFIDNKLYAWLKIIKEKHNVQSLSEETLVALCRFSNWLDTEALSSNGQDSGFSTR